MGRNGGLGGRIAGVVAFGSKAVSSCSATFPTTFTRSTRSSSSSRCGSSAPAFRQGSANPQSSGWALSGLTYFGYNIIGAVVILPVLRHLVSDRDAVVAGIVSGPLLWSRHCCSLFQWSPSIPTCRARPCRPISSSSGSIPAFHLLFQLMIFSALLESGTSSVHAINERIDHAWQTRRGQPLTHRARLAIALVLLVGCMFLASRFGLVALIANGYRALSYILLATFILPLVTIGVWQLWRSHRLNQEFQE